jgi:hypothetical protein
MDHVVLRAVVLPGRAPVCGRQELVEPGADAAAAREGGELDLAHCVGEGTAVCPPSAPPLGQGLLGWLGVERGEVAGVGRGVVRAPRGIVVRSHVLGLQAGTRLVVCSDKCVSGHGPTMTEARCTQPGAGRLQDQTDEPPPAQNG